MSIQVISEQQICLILAHACFAYDSRMIHPLMTDFLQQIGNSVDLKNIREQDWEFIDAIQECSKLDKFFKFDTDKVLRLFATILVKTNFESYFNRFEGCMDPDELQLKDDWEKVVNYIMDKFNTYRRAGIELSPFQFYQYLTSLGYNSVEAEDYYNSISWEFITFCKANLMSKMSEIEKVDWDIGTLEYSNHQDSVAVDA